MRRWVLLILITLGACGSDTRASLTGKLRETSCKTCRVVGESIAYLGHPDDSVALREDVIPSRDSRGRFYLADLKGGAVLVFGPDGRLMKTFGKYGRGPGEFVSLRAVFVARGDTLLVVGGPTIHVISPSYEHVREYRNLGGSIDEMAATILQDGRILSGTSRHRFVLIDSIGNVASRVTLNDIDSTPCGECGERIFREGRTAGHIWSAPLNRYRVEEHDLSGKLLRRFTREVSWFPEWSQRDIAARNVATELGRPRLMGVREDAQGMLWTHISGIEHHENLADVNEDASREMASLWGKVRTHVEAIDPATSEVLGGLVLEGFVLPMTGDYSAQLVVDDAGGWGWKVLRFSVSR